MGLKKIEKSAQYPEEAHPPGDFPFSFDTNSERYDHPSKPRL
jgi:hypothetical protein